MRTQPTNQKYLYRCLVSRMTWPLRWPQASCLQFRAWAPTRRVAKLHHRPFSPFKKRTKNLKVKHTILKLRFFNFNYNCLAKMRNFLAWNLPWNRKKRLLKKISIWKFSFKNSRKLGPVFQISITRCWKTIKNCNLKLKPWILSTPKFPNTTLNWNQNLS